MLGKAIIGMGKTIWCEKGNCIGLGIPVFRKGTGISNQGWVSEWERKGILSRHLFKIYTNPHQNFKFWICSTRKLVWSIYLFLFLFITSISIYYFYLFGLVYLFISKPPCSQVCLRKISGGNIIYCDNSHTYFSTLHLTVRDFTQHILKIFFVICDPLSLLSSAD